ncbi:hypothetical protein CC85DRAFT_282189 [Cutaneotrichosporon oleaginosum]|uniref:C2H2-type domain-containing protein n=1 Tax=Cutaneotrichosporon oleaginosum TaxID=879819 RepID=A0A0J0XYC7_9TREE|nr:uncharacterized protein CC85DRAFT_282189 [Cutaneotrichosporon oleaginosum]KLT46050.1 hypothetical protein CC85DRAFT_282189 [Cutaneotrichosporon oleaginosum]
MDTLPDLSFALGVPSASGAGSGSVARLVCQCGRQFTRIENLRRHQRNRESKLSCPVCSRTFRRPDVLKRHMRTHRDSAGSGSPPAPASAPAPAPAPAPAAGGPPPLAALMGALPTPGEASTSASASATALPAPPHAALEAVMHASVVHGPAYLTSTIPHIPYRPPRVHEADDDDSSSVDEDSDGSELGTWDGAIARAAAAGYTADSGYTLLSPRLAGERMHADDEWSLPGTSASEGGVWLSDAVYTRAKAWCDTRDRSIRWPDLATANALMEAHFERVEPQLPLIYLPTFRTAHAAPSLVAALLASGACAVRHTRARTFACEVAETLRRALDPSADALHALVLAYLAAAGCGSARAPLLLASLAALVRAQRLLAPRDPESEWGAWVRAETRTRLGLAVFLCDAALGIADVEGAAVPDAERWMLAPDAWLAREHASVGAACVLRSNADARLAALPRYPAPMGEFGARVLFATIQWGIRTYRAEERVFCRAQEVLGLALPARLHVRGERAG